MSTRVRQLIFLIVSFGSIAGLVWILFYSSGYHFNWTQLAWQATGGIRLFIQPAQNILVIILPNGLTSRASDTTFTHLLPGEYYVSVEAPDHLPVHLFITVQPNSTTVIDPLYLWPNQALLPVNDQPKPILSPETTQLPIVFQSILSQYDRPDSTDYYLVSQRQLIVLDPTTHLVMEYNRDGNVMTSQQLGSAISDMTLSQNKLLLASEFSLAVVDVSAHTTETITRLSTPIQQATWVSNTPYIAYATASQLHVIDSRSQTNYYDQLVATVGQPISQLWYDTALNSLWLTAADRTYRWPLDRPI